MEADEADEAMEADEADEAVATHIATAVRAVRAVTPVEVGAGVAMAAALCARGARRGTCVARDETGPTGRH